MKKTLGRYFDRGELTEEQNWVIVKDNQIVERYIQFKDAVKDKRGHLMTELYYNQYKEIYE
jgi:hypothetical protein